MRVENLPAYMVNKLPEEQQAHWVMARVLIQELEFISPPKKMQIQMKRKDWDYLHKLQVWPPGGATCIATLPMIILLTLSVGIKLLSSSARVTSVKFSQSLGVC